MNRQRAKELLPIIQAFAEGKTVQVKYQGLCAWSDVNGEDVRWHDDMEYRIKPEPVRVYVATWLDGDRVCSECCSENERATNMWPRDPQEWLRSIAIGRPGFRIDVIEREAP